MEVTVQLDGWTEGAYCRRSPSFAEFTRSAIVGVCGKDVVPRACLQIQLQTLITCAITIVQTGLQMITAMSALLVAATFQHRCA
jgi:hypothetical protein